MICQNQDINEIELDLSLSRFCFWGVNVGWVKFLPEDSCM